jgi:hypothetical protein
MKTLCRRTLAALLIAALGLSSLLVGCGGGSSEYAAQYYLTYCLEQQTPGDYTRVWLGRTGDETVDGIMQASNAVAKMTRADKKWQRARKDLNNELYQNASGSLDAAIAARPNDMRYRRDRVHAALGLGEAQEAIEQWEAMDGIASVSALDEDETYWDGALDDAQGWAQHFASRERASETPNQGGKYTAQMYASYSRMAYALERKAEIVSAQGGDASELLRQAADARAKAEEHSSALRQP